MSHSKKNMHNHDEKLRGCAPDCREYVVIEGDPYCVAARRRLVLRIQDWNGDFPIFCPGKIQKT